MSKTMVDPEKNCNGSKVQPLMAILLMMMMEMVMIIIMLPALTVLPAIPGKVE